MIGVRGERRARREPSKPSICGVRRSARAAKVLHVLCDGKRLAEVRLLPESDGAPIQIAEDDAQALAEYRVIVGYEHLTVHAQLA